MIDQRRLEEALRVYVVTDERDDSSALLEIAMAAVRGGATAIQLRRKQELGKRFVELGLTLRKMTRQHGVLLFVNDRVDVAAVIDADGVHVGQDDISCADARRLLPGKFIGVSAETVEQAVRAEQGGAHYLGVGAVFPTVSKPDAGFTGLDGLKTIVDAVSIPVVGIGGITTANTPQVLACGAKGVAVVSAVMSAASPFAATAEFRRQFDR